MYPAFDFTMYPQSNTYYGGSERKLGILVDGAEFMLKFRKEDPFGTKRNNHLSEFLGSHIFEELGFLVQETHLGWYKGEEVVACRNFVRDDETFVPFDDVGESSLEQDKDTYQYEYDDIMRMLRDNQKLTQVNQTIELFWDMYVVDALLGNFDRHGANWGFIKHNGSYRAAPIFDNGSCLYPSLTDEDEMRSIVSSREETEKRIFTFPTSQIRYNGQKSSYTQVIRSLAFQECNAAVARIYERCDMARIEHLVDNTPMSSDAWKTFMMHMLKERYRVIVQEPYEMLSTSADRRRS